MYNKLELPTLEISKTKTGYSTAVAELEKLFEKHKIIKPILEYRQLQKL
ncbi:MAG: DNA polymerase [Patescibacteria group bacterium]